MGFCVLVAAVMQLWGMLLNWAAEMCGVVSGRVIGLLGPLLLLISCGVATASAGAPSTRICCMYGCMFVKQHPQVAAYRVFVTGTCHF